MTAKERARCHPSFRRRRGGGLKLPRTSFEITTCTLPCGSCFRLFDYLSFCRIKTQVNQLTNRYTSFNLRQSQSKPHQNSLYEYNLEYRRIENRESKHCRVRNWLLLLKKHFWCTKIELISLVVRH